MDLQFEFLNLIHEYILRVFVSHPKSKNIWTRESNA